MDKEGNNVRWRRGRCEERKRITFYNQKGTDYWRKHKLGEFRVVSTALATIHYHTHQAAELQLNGLNLRKLLTPEWVDLNTGRYGCGNQAKFAAEKGVFFAGLMWYINATWDKVFNATIEDFQDRRQMKNTMWSYCADQKALVEKIMEKKSATEREASVGSVAVVHYLQRAEALSARGVTCYFDIAGKLLNVAIDINCQWIWHYHGDMMRCAGLEFLEHDELKELRSTLAEWDFYGGDKDHPIQQLRGESDFVKWRKENPAGTAWEQGIKMDCKARTLGISRWTKRFLDGEEIGEKGINSGKRGARPEPRSRGKELISRLKEKKKREAEEKERANPNNELPRTDTAAVGKPGIKLDVGMVAALTGTEEKRTIVVGKGNTMTEFRKIFMAVRPEEAEKRVDREEGDVIAVIQTGGEDDNVHIILEMARADASNEVKDDEHNYVKRRRLRALRSHHAAGFNVLVAAHYLAGRIVMKETWDGNKFIYRLRPDANHALDMTDVFTLGNACSKLAGVDRHVSWERIKRDKSLDDLWELLNIEEIWKKAHPTRLWLTFWELCIIMINYITERTGDSNAFNHEELLRLENLEGTDPLRLIMPQGNAIEELAKKLIEWEII